MKIGLPGYGLPHGWRVRPCRPRQPRRARTDTLLGSRDGALEALDGGYDAAFLVGAAFAAAALVALLLRPVRPPAGAMEEAPIGAAPAQETEEAPIGAAPAQETEEAPIGAAPAQETA